MLIRFSVENFKSFRDQSTFSMAATKGTRHPDHIHTINENRLLKGSFIFGANASGKSNLVEAMEFARRLVIKGVDKVDTSGRHFRLQEGCLERPGIFQFDFFANETQYSYGFALSYLHQTIVSEWLAVVGGDSVRYVFNRNQEEDGSVTIDSDIVSKSGPDKKRFDVYKDDFKDWKNEQLKNTFMLADIAKRTAEDTGFFKTFKEAFQWLDSLTFIYPYSRYYGIGEFALNPVLREKFETALHSFDTGITAIEPRSIPLDEMNENFKRYVGGDRAAQTFPRIIRQEKEIYQLERKDDGEIVVHQLVMNHGCDTELFSSMDESDGTIRLFDLLPLLLLQGPRVFVIDEIGRSLHSQLLLTYIQKFYERTKGYATQLIATTHESHVLNLDLLRQDEIWFVERQQDCSSRLYSLSEFKERFDKNIEREYLLGRYGAIPLFKEWESELNES